MVGFADLVAIKSAILNKEADARVTAADAEAKLALTKAGLLPGESAANIGLTRAQADQARTATDLAPGLAAAQSSLQRSQAGQNAATTAGINLQTQLAQEPINPLFADILAQRLGFTSAPAFSESSLGRGLLAPSAFDTSFSGGLNTRRRFAKGTAKVSNSTDTVPALLTPGEAVLNVGAAEQVGRGLIAALNQIGLAKMGREPQGFAEGTAQVPVPLPSPNPTPLNDSFAQFLAALKAQDPTSPKNVTAEMRRKMTGFAKGTAKVSGKPAGKSKASAPALDPRLLAALLQGGGGLPQGPASALPQGLV